MKDHDRIAYEFMLSPVGYTSGEWAQKTGSTKLPTRVGEMEDKGYVFEKNWESANGKRWIRYRLVSEPMEYRLEGSQVCFA